MYQIMEEVFGDVYFYVPFALVDLHPSIEHQLRRLDRPLSTAMGYKLWTHDNHGIIDGVLGLYCS